LRLEVRGRKQEEKLRLREVRLIASKLGLNLNPNLLLGLNLNLSLPVGVCTNE
jgi:hypothetical protein